MIHEDPKLIVTIVLSTGDIKEQFPHLGGQEGRITYQQIDHNVSDIIKRKVNLEKRKYHLFYRQRKQQKPFRGDENFSSTVHVVVRLDDDFTLLRNRIMAVKNTYLQEIRGMNQFNDLDRFGLARNLSVRQKKSYLSAQSSTVEHTIDIAIVVSNPLARCASAKPDCNEFVAVERVPINLRSLKKSIKKTLEETQPFVQIKIVPASKHEIEQASRDSAMILQVMCDVDSTDKEVALLLEDPSNPGQEQRVSIESLFSGTERHSLVIVIGKNANLALQPLGKKKISNCMAINTSCFNTDQMTHNFLDHFYRKLFRGFSIGESFSKSVEEVTISQPNKPIIKPTEICCCLHEHREGCKWKALEEKFGLETSHNEIHRVCIQQKCSLMCRWSSNCLSQIYAGQRQQIYATCQDLCCCYYGEMRAQFHTPKQKFFLTNENGPSLYPTMHPDVRVDTELIVRAPCMKCRVTSTYCESEYMPGRNLTIFNIVGLLKRRKIINIHDNLQGPNAEKLTLTRNALAYLLEREHPIEVAEIDMKTVLSTDDFQLRVSEKLSPSRKETLDELSRQFDGSSLILVFKNFQDYIRTNQQSFVEIAMTTYTSMACKLQSMFVVLLTSQKISSTFFIGEETYLIPGLSMRGAMESFLMFLLRYKNNGKSFIFKFSEQNMMEMEEAIEKLQKTLKQRQLQLMEGHLETFVKKLLALNNMFNAVDQALRDFLPQGLHVKQNEISLGKDLKVMLQFIAEFGEGLSDKDLDFLADLQFTSAIVRKDWRLLILDHLNEKDSRQENPQLKVCRHYYFDITQKFGSNLFQIKVNLRRLANLSETPGYPKEKLRLHALQYLAVSTYEILAHYRTSRQYSEHLLEYSNVSDTGVFYYRKYNRYKDIFEQSDQPDTEKQLCMSESSNIAENERIIHTNTRSFLGEMKPEERFLHHRENLLAIYRLNFEEQFHGEEDDSSQPLRPMSKATYRFSSHYYYMLLLNIPTLFRMQIGKVNQEVIAYTINNSIRCASNAKPGKVKNLLLIKLYFIEIGIKHCNLLSYEQEQFQDRKKQEQHEVEQAERRQQLQKTINIRIGNIGELAQQLQDDKQNILLVWECEQRMMRLFLLREQTTDELNFLKKTYKFFEKQKQFINKEADREGNWDLLMARLTLFTAQTLRKLSDKGSVNVLTTLKQIRPELPRQLEAAEGLYSSKDRVLLTLQCRLERMWLRAKMFFSEYHQKADEEAFCQQFKESLSSMRRMYFDDTQTKMEDLLTQENNNAQYFYLEDGASNNNITDRETVELYQKLREENTARIWKVFRNIFVFMRSDPKAYDAPNEPISVRRPSTLKQELGRLFQKAKKNIVGMFRILTEENLQDVLNRGCLFLVLTLNVEPDGKNIYLRLEDKNLPCERKILLGNSLMELFVNCNIDTIVFAGKNVLELEKEFKSRKVTSNLVFIDTLIDDPVDPVQEYFIRLKQQEIIELFLREYCNSMVRQDEEIEPRLRAQRCWESVFKRSETKNSINKPSKFTYRQCASRYMHFEYVRGAPSSIKREVSFSAGCYTDASGNTASPHNFIDHNANGEYRATVARQAEILWITKHLVQPSEVSSSKLESSLLAMSTSEMTSKTVSRTQYLNLYGPKGVGKRELLIDIGWQLILKNVFKDGVYRVDCNYLKVKDPERDVSRTILQFIEMEIPVLYKKLTESNKPLSMLLLLMNTHRVSDLDGDDLLRLVKERGIKVIYTTIHQHSGGKFPSFKLPLKQLNREESEILVCSLTHSSYVWSEVGVSRDLRSQILKGVNIEDYNSPLGLRDYIRKISIDYPGRWRDLQPYEDSIGVSMARSRKLSESNNMSFQMMPQSQLQSSILGSYMGSRMEDKYPSENDALRLMISSAQPQQRRTVKITSTGL